MNVCWQAPLASANVHLNLLVFALYIPQIVEKGCMLRKYIRQSSVSMNECILVGGLPSPFASANVPLSLLVVQAPTIPPAS